MCPLLFTGLEGKIHPQELQSYLHIKRHGAGESVAAVFQMLCALSGYVSVQRVIWLCFSSARYLVMFQFSVLSGSVSVQRVIRLCFSPACYLVMLQMLSLLSGYV